MSKETKQITIQAINNCRSILSDDLMHPEERLDLIGQEIDLLEIFLENSNDWI